MHTPNHQATLGRLYTNAAFRKEFVSDKKSFYRKYNFSLDTIQFIEGISVNQLTFFAESLLKKRMHEIKNLLPLTFKLLGREAHQLFLEFSDHYVPTGIHKHHEDALEFIAFLLKRKELFNRYLRAVLIYEKQQISNFTSRKKYLVRFYNYDFASNYSLLLNQTDPGELPRKFCVILWSRGKLRKIM